MADSTISGWRERGRVRTHHRSGERYQVHRHAAQAAIAATESRLAAVMQQLTRLAEETDSNPRSRLAALTAERETESSAKFIQYRDGGVKALPDDRALERIREIITLADELAGDFRRVRDEFDKLNRHLRESLMENEGSRGDVLAALFAGVDLIGESDAGKTFAAFWRLLIDPEQSAALETPLSEIIGRSFARTLEGPRAAFLVAFDKASSG